MLDTPVAREVYGAAALYLERPDPVLVAEALENLVGSAATRARLLAEAHTTLARYSWEDCAERTLQVLVESGATDDDPPGNRHRQLQLPGQSRPSGLPRLLGAALRTTRSSVVDNASHDGTADGARNNGRGCMLVEAGANVGFSRANNLGIRRTAASWCCCSTPTRVAAAIRSIAWSRPSTGDRTRRHWTPPRRRLNGRTEL